MVSIGMRTLHLVDAVFSPRDISIVTPLQDSFVSLVSCYVSDFNVAVDVTYGELFGEKLEYRFHLTFE